jgi:hypothetical protein
MSDKQNKFIGGGFPNIKECNETKEIINKESKKKREFSLKNLLPISQILINKKQPALLQDNLQKNIVLTETFNVIDDIVYEPVDNFLHKTYYSQKTKLSKRVPKKKLIKNNL